MKLEFAIWTLRGLINQLLPIATTFLLSRLGKPEEIAYLAPIFIACGIGNLLRSGAITATSTTKDIRSPISTEIVYTLLTTLPFLLITPAPSQQSLLLSIIIILASGASGAFAARLEKEKGLHYIGVCDLSALALALSVPLLFIDISPQVLAMALSLRECFYLFAVIALSARIRYQSDPKSSLLNYAKENWGQTAFWVSGPWKDYLTTNTAIALYSKAAYGTYYAVQLYWSLPVLFLGLMMRPALKAFQNGHATTRSIARHIFWLMLVSVLGLWVVQWAFEIVPQSSGYLTFAALLPAITAPLVTPAMLAAVKDGRSKDIVLQNLSWAVSGCAVLALMRHADLDGLATTILVTNAASIYIIIRHRCSRSYI